MARHSSMADQLGALKRAIARPEGDIEAVKTNWSTVAANDNNPEDFADKRIERRWSIRPTIDEIKREIEEGETVCGEYTDENDKSHKIITAIGKLRFSDGSQTERAYAYGPDGKVIMYDAPMPIGAMLGTRDKQERTLGGDGVGTTNTNYTKVYGGKYPKAARRKAQDPGREKRNYSRQESIAELEIAKSNTFALPKVTVCAKGFPWQPANLRDLFLGLEKGKKGESGSIAWQDISTHIIEREIWSETIAALNPEDKDTLKAAETASSLADISPLAPKRTAIRKGKSRLIALNDNIEAAYKKSAA